MTKMTYKEQLLHPNWQRKRLHMLNAANWKCSNCDGDETTLHVHHKRYIKGRMAWEYEDDELRVLCATCHSDEHASRDLLDRLLADSDYGDGALPIAIGLLAGYLDANASIDAGLSKAAISIDGHSYHLGVFAALASGADWKKLADAARLVSPGHLSPVESATICLWSGES